MRWEVSNKLLGLSNTSGFSNEVSTPSKIIHITSNTILDFCRPSISDPINLKNTYHSKSRDFKNSFNIQYVKYSCSISSRPQRSVTEASTSAPVPYSESDTTVITRLLSSSCLKSRRFTIKDTMLTPPIH